MALGDLVVLKIFVLIVVSIMSFIVESLQMAARWLCYINVRQYNPNEGFVSSLRT